MNEYTSALFSLRIGISGALALFKAKTIDPFYRPFLYLLLAGFVNEAVSFALIQNGYSNLVNYNLFVLTECLLIVWLFRNGDF